MGFGQPHREGNPGRIVIEHLSWGPSAHQTLLHDLDFTVEPGEMMAIVGPNGAGKSSLLRCLYRYHRPRRGRVLLDGQDIWALKPKQVARRMATVLQEPASDFGLSVAEIVALGLQPVGRAMGSAIADDAIEAALLSLGLAGFAARDFASLSGGEKQRVMIARALVQQPDVLILDEPTNHLDIRYQLDILELLTNLSTTVIVSLHDLSLACAYADRVLVLDGGRQVRLGTPLQVLTPRTIREVFAVETAIDRHPATGRPRFSFHMTKKT